MQDSRKRGKTLGLESTYGAKTRAPAVVQGELELGREGCFGTWVEKLRQQRLYQNRLEEGPCLQARQAAGHGRILAVKPLLDKHNLNEVAHFRNIPAQQGTLNSKPPTAASQSWLSETHQNRRLNRPCITCLLALADRRGSTWPGTLP